MKKSKMKHCLSIFLAALVIAAAGMATPALALETSASDHTDLPSETVSENPAADDPEIAESSAEAPDTDTDPGSEPAASDAPITVPDIDTPVSDPTPVVKEKSNTDPLESSVQSSESITAFSATEQKTTSYALANPNLTSATNTSSGIKLVWGAVSGAAKYRVFYKTGSENSWTKITDTTATNYTWTNAKAGTKYTFTVRCLSADGKSYSSGYDATGLTLFRLTQPNITSFRGEDNGVKISWNQITGAEKYRVYRKSGDSWTKLAETESTSCIVNAEYNKNLVYTVRAFNDTDPSSYDKTGSGFTRTENPNLTSATNTSSGIKLAWGAVSGAAKYRIFYRIDSGNSWTKITDTTATNYTWTNAKAGTKYAFTVRCLTADGKSYSSSYDTTGLTLFRLTQPNITSLRAENNGVKISWNQITGAEKYRVYRKSGDGWTKLAETESTSCILNAEHNKNFVYTVRAFNDTDPSSYDKTGSAFMCVTTPKLSSAADIGGGIKLTWDAVSGAAKYRVFYKIGSGNSWTKVTDTTSNSFTWTNPPKNNTEYTFTVRCLSADGKSYTSGYDTVGKSAKYILVAKNKISGSSYYGSDGVLVSAAEIKQAVAFVNAHSSSSQSNANRLYACYQYLWQNYPYARYYDTPNISSMPGYANTMFSKKSGNCYRYAAAFAYIARVLGYDSRVAVGMISSASGGMTPHGWTEVKVGNTWYICDANMQRNIPSINSYMKTDSTYAYAHSCHARYTLTVSKGQVIWK